MPRVSRQPALNCQWGLDSSTTLSADVLVLVDGKLRFSRIKTRKQEGPSEINVSLSPKDRFLTLISTDGGDGIQYDNICLLNPRILLQSDSPEGRCVCQGEKTRK